MPLSADNLSHWQRLAEKGSANAQFNLGVLYANGEGVLQGSSESYVWLNIAAMAGNKNLAIKRDRAAEKLTTEELNLAQQRAAELFEEIQQNKMN
jgi:hypothetical protein